MASKNALLIKNGTVVTSAKIYKADVAIEHGKIRRIGKNLQFKDAQIIDAQNCYVFPGGVDAHTHMDLPFKDMATSDDFETGSKAALCGGTTTILDFANQTRGQTLAEAIQTWHAKAQGRSFCDYGFHVSVTDFNERTRAEIRECIEKEGITSFKTFMAYKSNLMIDDRQMLELMNEVAALGGLVTVHAENGDWIDFLIDQNRKSKRLEPQYHVRSRPAAAETEAVSRVIHLAAAANCPVYIVHLSSGAGLEEGVRAALNRAESSRGVKTLPPVFFETCTQYLTLDETKCFEPGVEGAKFVCSPPLRTKRDQKVLWKGISEGAIHVVATDHCSFWVSQKALGVQDFSLIPNGLPGVENRMEVLYSEGVAKGRMSLQQFVRTTSTTPARIFGLYPQKGEIAPGSDADLVVFDPKKRHTLSAHTHHMNCDYSVYEGLRVQGQCRLTIHRGVVAAQNGEVLVPKGFGRYLKRQKLKRT